MENKYEAEAKVSFQVAHLLGKEEKAFTNFEFIISVNELLPEKINLFKTFAFSENSCSRN